MPPSAAASDIALLDAFWREPVLRTVLPNGLTLILKPDHSAALASVQVWVKTGSVHEGGNLGSGLSHYLEHMLFKGTTRRSGREISASVQAHGGNINAYTTFDRTVYYVDLPSEHVGFAVDLLADAVLHSTLPPAEAEKEKGVILREIAMTRDDPDDRLWESVFASAFREHPYRHPIIGHREVFSSATPEDLGAYYRARYVPNNLAVVIVGAIDPAAVQEAVARHFGAAPRARLAPVLVPAEPRQLAPREQHSFEDVEVSRAVLAWQIPGLTHPDAPVLDLLSMLLGHGDSSILWRELREKAGLVHTIDATSWNPGSSGLFCISLTCDAGKRAAATAAVERTLARAGAQGFTAAQARKAMRQLVVGEINSRKTMSGQAARLGAAEVVVGDLDYSRSYFESLRSVTAADLRRVMAAYLVPMGRTTVSINPAAAAPGAPAPVAATGKGGARRAAGRSRAVKPPAPAKTERGNTGAVIPDFTAATLPNGARLLIQRNPRLPNLHFRLLMEGGPRCEASGRRGSSALLATLLAKDTRRRSATAIAEAIEQVGGSWNAFAGNNSLGLAAEVLPPDAGRALGVVADAILEPAFRPATFGTERDAQLAALRQDADDVVTFARKLVRQKFFGSHPLALDAYGDIEGVSALGVPELAAMHRRLAVGGNIVLAVAGDLPAGLEEKLRRFLARLPAGGPPFSAGAASRRRTEEFPAASDSRVKQPREQAVVLQAFPAPPMHAADYYVGEVADELFSGMASRLFERVREEKALAYFVRSTRVTGLDAAMFCFFAGTQGGKEEEVLAEIDAEIRRVQSGGVEAAELGRCQARLKSAHRQSLQTNAACAFYAGLGVLQGRSANDWKNYDARVDAVTLADLAVFAQRYFQRSQRTQLIVSPQ